MAMPVNDKTWVFNVNNEVQTGVQNTDMRNVYYAMYRAFVDSGLWIPVACSWHNGSTFSISTVGDGDHEGQFLDADEIVWRVGTSVPGNKSWAVLRFKDTTMEILFQMHMAASANPSIQVFLNETGYNISTGTIAAVPAVNSGTQWTITNSNTTSSGTASNYIPGGTSKKIWNSAVSSDGECCRFWTNVGGLCVNYFEFAKIKNPVPGLIAGGLTDDWWFMYNHTAQASILDVTTYSRMYTNAKTYTYGFVTGGSTRVTFELSGEASNGSALPVNNYFTLGPNPLDNNSMPISPIGLWTPANLSYSYGRMGEIYDMWWGASNLITGTTFPGDGSKTHIMLGNVVIPWDAGVIPVIT